MFWNGISKIEFIFSNKVHQSYQDILLIKVGLFLYLSKKKNQEGFRRFFT